MKKWLKKLFHKHDIVWTSRKVVENITLCGDIGGVTEPMKTKVYLYEGYCYKCGQKGFVSKVTIANIFDKH